MGYTLAIKASLYKQLRTHLLPGDGLEAAAILLCYSGKSKCGIRVIVDEVIAIPQERCQVKTSTFLTWPFAEFLTPERVEEIDKKGQSLFTIHSHPTGYSGFSVTDDNNDILLFESIVNWFDDDRPNGTAIMLSDGKIMCRRVDGNGNFIPFESVSVVGDSIKVWKRPDDNQVVQESGHKVAQTFGKGTYELLRKLNIGVLGCSGTGSIITELLARNCVANLVLADPDYIEEKNLNRILNSCKYDAENSVPKVTMLKEAIERMGFGTNVDVYIDDTNNPDVIEAFAGCDVIFGCVDSAQGRYHLECLTSGFLIPYFDLGVHLEADGTGNISQADVVSNYMHPDNASLMSRNIYTSDQVTAEGWKKNDPEYYKKQEMAGYLAGVNEDQPAVLSLNMLAASLAFNDFIARLHNFRLDANMEFNSQTFRLAHGCYLFNSAKLTKDSLFHKYQGMGDKSYLIQNLKERNNS